jgi:hypothetical protein
MKKQRRRVRRGGNPAKQKPRRQKKEPGLVHSITGYYHGGAPGRFPGSLILPQSEVNSRFTAELLEEADGDMSAVYRRDRAYLTSSLVTARRYAMMYPTGHGAVYEVEPIGRLEPDPDYPPGECYMVERARVVRVVKLGRAAFQRDRAFELA